MEESSSDRTIEVDCSQGDSSTVSIVTVPETTLDDSSAAAATTTSQIDSDNNLQNQGPGLPSVPVTSLGNISQDGLTIDIPVNRSNDAVVMFRVSLADFGKIPVHQIFHLKPDQTVPANETLNTSTQSTCDSGGSYVFRKTAAEATAEQADAAERVVSQGIVDYSVSSKDMSTVEMFQMTKQDPTTMSSSETMMPRDDETASGNVDKMPTVDTTPGDEETASSSVDKMSPADTTTEDVQTASGEFDQTSPADTMLGDNETTSGDVDKMPTADTTPRDKRDVESSEKPSPQPKDDPPTKIQPER